MESVIGRFAWSRAGRDKDRLFVITAVVDDNHVLLVDGDVRRVEKPKRKKLRHLEILPDSAGMVAETLRVHRKLLDADVREAIRQQMDEEKQESRDREG